MPGSRSRTEASLPEQFPHPFRHAGVHGRRRHRRPRRPAGPRRRDRRARRRRPRRAARAAAAAAPSATFDAAGALVLPGFVHGHLHLCQTLFRGLAEQSDLLRWLRESIWPLEAAHTAASIAASARLGLLRADRGRRDLHQRHGHGAPHRGDRRGARGVRDPRGVRQGADGPGRRACRAALLERRRRGARRGARARGALPRRRPAAGCAVSLAPRFILSCSERAVARRRRRVARARPARAHAPRREPAPRAARSRRRSATTAARYFAERGVLGPRFVGAHGVWLDADELRAAARGGRGAGPLPGLEPQARLGAGRACGAWRRRRRALRARLATAPPATTGSTRFHEMSARRRASRASRDPARPLAARDVVALATCDGARGARARRRDRLARAGQAGGRGRWSTCAAPHHGPEPERDPYATLVHAARASRRAAHDGRGPRALPRRRVDHARSRGDDRAEARAERRGLLRRVRGRPRDHRPLHGRHRRRGAAR